MIEDEDEEDLFPVDLLRGQYLCDLCEEAMTDVLWPAAESPTGTEVAICLRCAARVRPA